MCIIISKPEGVLLPTRSVLDNCGRSNRDGIGIAWTNGSGVVNIKKGFQFVTEFEKWMVENIKKEYAAIIHFRLATHGKCDEGNCHPFPVSTSKKDLRQTETMCELAMAHNGVFYGLGDKKYSDTQDFIANVIADPIVAGNLGNKAVQELICGYIGNSKLAFIDGSGNINLYGSFEKSKGLAFSNSGYKDYKRYNDWQQGRTWDNKSGKWVDDAIDKVNNTGLLEDKTCDDKKESVALKDSWEYSCATCYKLVAKRKMVAILDEYSDDGYGFICRSCYYSEKYGKKGYSTKDKK